MVEELGDFGDRTFVVDFKLSGGALAGRGFVHFDSSPFHGEVEVVGPGTGVAARVGLRTGRDVGHSEREKGVTQRGWLAGRKNDANLGEADAEGGEELHQAPVVEREAGVRGVLVIAGMRPHAGEGDGEAGFPAVTEEVIEVGGEGDRFVSPVGEAEEGPDSDATETAGVGPLRTIEPPVEVLLGTCGVELTVSLEVIGFLVNDEALGTVIDQLAVLVVFHRADLDTDGRDQGLQGIDAFLQVAVRDEFRVLAGDEKKVAEAQIVQVFCLRDHLGHREGGAEDGVVARKAAVLAVVDALV